MYNQLDGLPVLSEQRDGILTWIISVISAIHCCLVRKSPEKESTSTCGADLGICTFNAVAINSKTYKKYTSQLFFEGECRIPWVEMDVTLTWYKLETNLCYDGSAQATAL